MHDPRTAIVRDGYDRIARRYLSWGARVEDDPRERFVEELVRRLPHGAPVLDLGCGAGVGSMQRLAERFAVTGVDVSEAQLALARRQVPSATLVHADLASVTFPADAFDGVAALYSISHLPREDHARLFGRILRWLRPGGFLVASLGAADDPGHTTEWLGVPMFFASHDADENRRLLREAGFELVLDDVVTMREPEGEVAFLWVLARRAR